MQHTHKAIIRIRLLILCSCLVMGFHGRGQELSETRALPAFQELHLNGSLLLILSKGRAYSLKISGSDTSEFSRVRSEVSHGILHIWYTNNRFFAKNRNLRVFVTAPSLDRVDLTGSGMVESRSVWTSDSLSLKLNGSGQIVLDGHSDLIQADLEGSGRMRLRTTCRRLKARLMGSGNLTLSGTSGNAALEVDGSGLMDARTLKSRHETRRILGSGMILN